MTDTASSAAPDGEATESPAPSEVSELEALIFSSPDPVSEDAAAAFLGSPAGEALDELAAFYRGRGITLERSAEGWRFAPTGDVAAEASAFHDGRRPRRLSEAALATLAVIAMHQPVTIPDIESARGVKLSRNVLESLTEAGLVRQGSRRSGAGRAVSYVTTDAFLDQFSLDALSDMPTPEEAEMMDLGGPYPQEDQEDAEAPRLSPADGEGTVSSTSDEQES